MLINTNDSETSHHHIQTHTPQARTIMVMKPQCNNGIHPLTICDKLCTHEKKTGVQIPQITGIVSNIRRKVEFV